MTRKQWALFSLCLLFLGIGGIIGTVVLIDPFEVYHQATAFIPPIDNGTQNYSNAGIAKSYDYDSVIIGSSMTENFTPSQLDRLLGGHFVKLPINAGSPFNNWQMLDMAFRTHDVKTVLYGLDVEAFTYFYKTPKCEMPDYLYDDNLFNDVKYWFNQSVLAEYIPAALSTWGQTDPDLRDTMYTWGDQYPYGKEAALRGITILDHPVEQAPVETPVHLSQQTMLNVTYNILPFIEEHPDTQFLFFYPPYALVRWHQFYADGQMEYHLSQRQAIAEALLPYDNVKVFDFQGRTDWILNLDHYIDDGHYGPWINDAMVEDIRLDRCRVTSGAQVEANNAVLRRAMDTLIAAGEWPDSWPE